MRWSFADKVELAGRQTGRQADKQTRLEKAGGRVRAEQQQQSDEKMNADADGATRVWSLDCCRSDGCVKPAAAHIKAQAARGSRCLL